MPETLRINLARPIAGLHVVDGSGHSGLVGATADGDQHAVMETEQRRRLLELERQAEGLAQLCKTIDRIATQLNDHYQETIAENRGEIAKLAVEIARRILKWKTDEGDYDIHAVVEEALKQAPTRQNLVVRVNPEDLPHCQQLQQQHPDGPFAELNLCEMP